MKKRSPALQEDIAPRGLKLDPSAGGSGEDRAPFLNVLTYIQRLGKLTVRKSTQSIVKKLATLGTDAEQLINQARAYVRQRDAECRDLMVSTDPLFEAIWKVYDTGTDSEKAKLSGCLGLFSDAMRRTPQTNPTQDLIRQGCKELGLAAALFGYGEARSRLRAYFDPAINDIIKQRYTDELQRELGDYGPDLRVSMEEDEEIEPILSAAERATRRFEDLTSTGSQPVFRFNKDVGMNLILHPGGTYTQAICYDPNSRSQTIPEARLPGTLLELNVRSPSRGDVKQTLRPEKIRRGGGGPTRKAPDSDVSSLDQAFEQLKQTDPSVVDSLAKRGLSYDSPWALGNGSTINALGARGQPLSKLTFSFPRDNAKRGSGSLMGEPTYIASIGTTDFQKLATGIAHKFLSRSAVRTRVSPSAFRLICDALAGPGKCSGDAYKGSIFDLFETIGRRGGSDPKILKPLMLVVYYLIREASAGGGKEDGYDRPFYMQQYMRDAYDMNVGFHALAAWAAENAGESLPPGVLDVRPGSKTPGIFDRIKRASKSKSLSGMYRALRDNDVLRTIGVAGGNISIINGDDDEQQFDVSGPEEIDLVQKRERITRAFDSMIKDHVPDLIKSLVRSTNYIKQRPSAPNTSINMGGNLPLMTFCVSVAENKRSSIAVQAMTDMGCRHEGSLAFMQEVKPLMVWNMWAKIAGIDAMPSANVGFAFNTGTEFRAWAPFATGAPAAKLAGHVSQLLHSQFVLPVIACLYVALHEFRAQRLLTETEFEQYYKELSSLANDAEIKFNQGVSIRLNATTVTGKVSAAGTYTMRTGLKRFGEAATSYPQAAVGKVEPQLKRVKLADGAPFIIDIEDKYIMPRDLPAPDATAAPPTPSPATPSPAAPPAVETPAAPPAEPQPSPSPSSREIRVTQEKTGGETIRNRWVSDPKKRNPLRIIAQSGGFEATFAAASPGNAANSTAVEQEQIASLALIAVTVATAKSGGEMISEVEMDDLKQALGAGRTSDAEEIGKCVAAFLDKHPELEALPGVTAVSNDSAINVVVSPRRQ